METLTEIPEGAVEWSDDDLRSRLITGYHAVQCCRTGVTRGASAAGMMFIQALQSIVQAGWGEDGLGLIETSSAGLVEISPNKAPRFVPYQVPEVAPLPRTPVVSPGTIGGVGALLLIGQAFLNDLAQKEGALEAIQTAMDLVPTIVGTVTRRSVYTESCVECVLRNLLPQTNPRKRMTVKINRRL